MYVDGDTKSVEFRKRKEIFMEDFFSFSFRSSYESVMKKLHTFKPKHWGRVFFFSQLIQSH